MRKSAVLLAVCIICFGWEVTPVRSDQEAIRVIPPEPTSADEIVVLFDTYLPTPCYEFICSEPHRSNNTFEAVMYITPAGFPLEPVEEVCVQIPAPAACTYDLGRLEPGDYQFVQGKCEALAIVSWEWGWYCEGFSVTFHVGETIEEILDENDNGRLDDDEILFAVELWIEGEEVPGTSIPIDDATILRLIELWVTGAEISPSR